jgi:hypothetical protein
VSDDLEVSHWLELPDASAAHAAYEAISRRCYEHAWAEGGDAFGLRIGLVSPTLVFAGTTQRWGYDRSFADFLQRLTAAPAISVATELDDEPDSVCIEHGTPRSFRLAWTALIVLGPRLRPPTAEDGAFVESLSWGDWRLPARPSFVSTRWRGRRMLAFAGGHAEPLAGGAAGEGGELAPALGRLLGGRQPEERSLYLAAAHVSAEHGPVIVGFLWYSDGLYEPHWTGSPMPLAAERRIGSRGGLFSPTPGQLGLDAP